MPEDRVGTRLGAYRIERLIGRGGMGMVFLAEHVHLGRKVALKILPPDLAADEGFRKRFVRESRLAAGIEHPNVIPVYDAGEADGELYIAMRYVEGTDLRALLQRNGRLDDDEALAILQQVAAALDAAHRDGLVHRDVKPGNILITPTRHVYLSDFGLTKRTAADTSVTATGFFVGTMSYAPPEQIQGHDLDGRADEYSMACVAFECLTGRLPFIRETDVALLYAHLQDPPPDVGEIRGDLPPSVGTVLARGMAKSRDDRYPTCGALVDELRRALLAAPVPADETPTEVGAGPPPTAAPPTVQAGPPAAVATTPSVEPISPPPAPTEAAPAGGGPPPRRRVWPLLAVGAVVAAVAAFLVIGPLTPTRETPNGGGTTGGSSPTDDGGQPSGEDLITFLRPGTGDHYDVYTMKTDGTARRLIHQNIAIGSTPSWSPDRRDIVLEGQTGGDSEIYRLRMEPRGRLKNLTDNGVADMTPSWSPDGSAIAYASHNGVDFDIWVMDADGGNPHRLFPRPGNQIRPSWSPDGTQLAFEEDGDIFVVPATGAGEPTAIVSDPSSKDTAPEWSPEEDTIVFRSDRDGNLEIYTVGVDGTDPTRLTETAAEERAPTWSPDGSQILFHSDRGGDDLDIWIMNADGTGQEPLTRTQGDEFGASL